MRLTDKYLSRVYFIAEVEVNFLKEYKQKTETGEVFADGVVTVVERKEMVEKGADDVLQYFESDESYILFFRPVDSEDMFKLNEDDISSIELLFEYQIVFDD